MARQRISKIYPRDVRALSALGRVGHVTHDQLGEFLRDKRIASYQKDGLIERVVYSRPGGKTNDQVCYKLTKAGRDFCRTNLSLGHTYGAQSPAHDLALSERYFSLSATERETWRTEGETREQMAEHIRQLQKQGENEQAQALWDKMREGQISMPDAVYTSDSGTTIAYEVVTNNYGEAEIEAKEEAAEALGASLELAKA